jgi:hypothetical protein
MRSRHQIVPAPLYHYAQPASSVAAMQFDAIVIEFVIVSPSRNDAPAMPAPTMARISAYSAAEAPESSFRNVLMKVMLVFLIVTAN